MFVGIHTGNIGFDFRLLDAEPAIDTSWDEAVEFPFVVTDGLLQLQGVLGCKRQPVALQPGSYRGRYYARNVDTAYAEDTNGGEPIDFYRLELWPSGEHGDRVLKVTSEAARRWHDENPKAYGSSHGAA